MGNNGEVDPAPMDSPHQIVRSLKSHIQQLRAAPGISGQELFHELEAILRDIESALRPR